MSPAAEDVLGSNKRGMNLAVVVIDQEEMDRLEKVGSIKIGFGQPYQKQNNA